VRFPSWYLGNYPTHSIITGSHSKDLAERFGPRNSVGSLVFRETSGCGLSGNSGAGAL
jgi:hypothetical protein